METETVEQQVAVLSALPDIVPREVEKMYPSHMIGGTCVYTVRVLIDVLRHFGIKARPTPCAVAIFNDVMVRRCRKEGHFPRSMDEMREWSRQDGSWGVQIGRTGESHFNRLDAHLVAVTHKTDESEGVMLDMALQQNSRPQRRMMLEPVVATLPDGFFADGKPLVAEVGPQGSWARYEYLPEQRGMWTNGADWTDPGRRHATVAEAIRRIEQRLSA